MTKNQITIKRLFLEGILEILKDLDYEQVKRFKDFRKLVNKRTNKKFSPTTLSKKLLFLEKNNLIRLVVLKGKRGKVVGYQITESGKEVLQLVFNLENLLKSITSP